MKTIITNAGLFIEVDFENQTAKPISSDREAINRVYMVQEKCTISDGDKKIEAEPGDIIVRFYEDSFKHRTIVVKSEEWAENIKEYNEMQAANSLKWAEQLSNSCCDACETSCEARKIK